MTTAVDYLATKGVTVAQAYGFIMNNISSPETIFNGAKAFGLSNQMLGEILGIGTDVVKNFWSGLGFDPAQLDGGTGTTAADFLSTKNITMAQAHDYIMSNIANPAKLFGELKVFGLTNQMLGEILGVGTDLVKSFWSGQSLDPTQLDTAGGGSGSQVDLFQAYLDNPVVSTPYGALDASKGAFNYVVDMATVINGAQVIIHNFGSDDTLSIANGNAKYSTLAITPSSGDPGHYMEYFSVYDKTFPASVVSVMVILDNIPSVPAGQTEGIVTMKPIPELLTAFNSLPVGDLYWS